MPMPLLRILLASLLVTLSISAASLAPYHELTSELTPQKSTAVNLGSHVHATGAAGSDTEPSLASVHHHDEAGVNSISSNSSTTLIPVPHKMKHSHGMLILHMDLLPEERLFWENYSTETFFTTKSNHRAALFLHIASYFGSYFFLFPIVLVLWNIHHGLFLPALTLHTALIVISSISYWIFMASVREDLYPNSAFATMTSLLFIGSIVHWVVAAIAVGYRAMKLENQFEYGGLESEEELLSMASPTLTLRESNSRFESFELDDILPSSGNGHLQTSNDSMIEHNTSELSPVLHKYPILKRLTQAFGRTALASTSIVNWALFAFFLVYFPTGLATYLRYGQDEFKFNLLAHFIKGGVFFVLGLVSLARYCGAFKTKGWAWNHRFVTAGRASTGWLKYQSKGLFTMEMVESSLILFYGSTNIFMEHMANSNGAWSAKDLQHVSIAFIYIGCGLCGVLLEKMLANWRHTKAVENASLVVDSKQLAAIEKATPGFSPNPFPVLTIYWTGVLMSLHEQASEISTEIHKQWGDMFVLSCAFRVVTYMYFLLKPTEGKGLTKPAYPITELLVSFGLLCGGAIFMESCDSVVHLLEYYGLTLMFTLNICLGLVALIMAWVMAVFFVKDSLVARMTPRKSSV